jgi:molecular chaperone GrpE (heat shock protein)
MKDDDPLIDARNKALKNLQDFTPKTIAEHKSYIDLLERLGKTGEETKDSANNALVEQLESVISKMSEVLKIQEIEDLREENKRLKLELNYLRGQNATPES